MKQRASFLHTLAPFIELHRDPRTGIAWVENGRDGTSSSAHPCIDRSGSVAGMRQLGSWGKKDRVVRTRGFIYDIDRVMGRDDAATYAAIATCQCNGVCGQLRQDAAYRSAAARAIAAKVTACEWNGAAAAFILGIEDYKP